MDATCSQSRLHTRTRPTNHPQIHTPLLVKANAFSFEQLALSRAALPATARADLAVAVDDSMPGHIRITGKSSHGIPDGPGRTPSHDPCNLAIGSHLAGRNVMNHGIYPLVEAVHGLFNAEP